MAAASRSAKRFSPGVPHSDSSSVSRHFFLAFCTSSHVSQPPTRFVYMACVLLAFSACERRLMICASGLGSELSTASDTSRLAYAYETSETRPLR